MLRRILCALFLSTALFAQAPLMLGVLEDSMGPREQDPHVRFIRALFYKTDSEWKAFPADCTTAECLAKLATDFPRESAWTIAFDAKNIGEVHSRIPTEITAASRAGQQDLLDRDKAPTVGQRTETFSGFLGEPVLRPLVAVSEPNVNDPDQWKPVLLDATSAAKIRRAFRTKFPRITNCETEEIHNYADAEIKVLRSYRSQTGWRLVHTSLDGCDVDDMRGDGLNDEWFTLDPGGTARYLASALVLVDAGDYDHSGHSQLLFMIDDYNRGGYVLFYDEFRKSVTFAYRFH